MGYYHKNFPDNVQKNKTRHICDICEKKRFEKFMVKKKMNWGPNAWVCKENCISKEW